MFENSLLNRVLYKASCALLLPLCLALWLLKPGLPPSSSGEAPGWGHRPAPTFAEPPPTWNGRPLRPLALGPAEQRFARHFPGTLMRMTDGEQVLVLRTVLRPTRMLHPAPDCYRSLGYRIAAERLQLDLERRLWRCFEAVQGAQRLLVCERIESAAGESFTDTSAWYWSALIGRSSGPWQAVTVARPI